ncbi:MAG: filamentous hemagglutinin family protein [Verrucomicrobia bacterium]|nr:filamentous hemagglutinin family protein [Verrucomicrobiota bacterium]
MVALLALLPLSGARAGDILRGGVPAGDQAQRAASQNQNINAAAAAARANARDTLARTTRTIQEAQRFQEAARAAATTAGRDSLGINPNLPGNVPLPDVANGLHPGGLEVDPGVSAGTAPWTGADLPTGQPVGHQPGDASNVRIRQTAQTALLSWKTFHVGRKTTLTYDQTAGGANTKKWVAFNQITDPTGVPSQILGSIKADGQVYVINRNGIIFGPNSQVRMPTFVATSIPINTNLIQRGLLNNPDAQFLFSGIDIPQGKSGTPPFTPGKPFVASGRYGDVTVQPGAVLSSPTDSAKAGGRIMLVGANVTNGGTISTPDGQTILAAGLQVGIDGHASSDASLRGLDVFVGAVAAAGDPVSAGTVTVNGIVESMRGNVTLAGRAVRQNGVIDSSTSVSYNGRIDIEAIYESIPNSGYNPTNQSTGRPFLPITTGSVEFGPGSVTRIRPETESAETVIGTRLALNSAVNVTGKTVFFQSGSTLQANSGDITVRAGRFNLISGSVPVATFVRSGGQVYLDGEVTIDASGSVSASIPIARGLLNLELRGAEFARSPVQRDGVLRGVPITVDARQQGTYNGYSWVGTPLGNVSGYVNLLQRDVAELTAGGGSVSLISGGSLVMQPTSKVDVSGGFSYIEGGTVQTTRLISNGLIIDIKDATPDRVYTGVYDGTSTSSSTKWGVTRTFAQPLAMSGERTELGYFIGATGGKLVLNAASMALDGQIVGRTLNGQHQLDQPAPLSSLQVSFLADDTKYPTTPAYSPTPPSVIFSGVSLPRVGNFSVDISGDPLPLPTERRDTVALSPSLLNPDRSGFGLLKVNNPDGNISVPSAVKLETVPLGKIELNGSNLSIAGDILSPGGKILLTANNQTLDAINLQNENPAGSPVALPGRGNLTIGSSSTLSVAGLLVDLSRGASALLPSVLGGGSLTLKGYNVSLNRGSVLDASGGVKYENRLFSFGDGGSIAISAGSDTNVDSVLGGLLVLNGELRGFSGAKGGSLSLGAPGFQIGGQVAHPDVLKLTPSFFSKGGFSEFNLEAAGIVRLPIPNGPGGVEAYIPGIDIAPGTFIRPIVGSLTAVANRPGENTGFRVRRDVLSEGIRSPVALSFSAGGASDPVLGLVVRGDVNLGSGAYILTDALSQVTFNGQTVTLDGSVAAPGGSITVNGAKSLATASSAPGEARTTVYLGSGAKLSTAGKVVPLTGERGARSDLITPGGSVKVSGNIVAERGSVIDVSGTSGIKDLAYSYAAINNRTLTGPKGEEFTAVRLDTNAGRITLEGGQMLYADSTLVARSGGRSAIGGSLTVASSRFISSASFTSADINLEVSQSGFSLTNAVGSRGIGQPLLNSSGQSLPGVGTFVAERLRGSGINSLTLDGNVRFLGDVTVAVPGQLSVGSGGVIATEGVATLQAPAIKLGQPIPRPFLALDPIIPFTRNDSGLITQYYLAPNFGSGRLEVETDLFETGNLVLQNIGNARFSAPRGDIRGAGNLLMAGDMVLEAGQVYPTTAGKFNIYAYNYTAGGVARQGSITVSGGSSRPLPWSAGGALTLQSARVTQSGTLRAPFGTISLGWDGTGSAPVNPVSGPAIATPLTTEINLGANSVTSVSAVDPRSGKALVLPYGISFDGLSWIDPAGNDITSGGLPAKSIRLGGQNIAAEAGATVDLRGGGDVFAYRWVEGNGGPEDILASSSSFAVIPSYGFNYAPFAPFNNRSTATSLQGQPGYLNNNLRVGDQVTLGSGAGLPAGTYTMLPARYALLAGAYLIRPVSGDPAGSNLLPEGAALVNGYRANNLAPGRSGVTSMERFEVSPRDVVTRRAEYQLAPANSFLRQAALARDLPAPRLPIDAGYLAFSSTASLQLRGDILGGSPAGGRGSVVDISSPIDILINADGSGGSPGTLALSSRLLSQIRAESLLIGGARSASGSSAPASVTTNRITLDNAGAPLTGSDIILAARQSIALAANSEIRGTGSASQDAFLIGNNASPGSGDGAAVRVSGASSAPVIRSGLTNSLLPSITVGNDVALTGESLTLDSTGAFGLAPSATLTASNIALSGGLISLQLAGSASIPANDFLSLTRNTLDALQSEATSISLLSYTSIDLYGAGTFGGASLDSLSLQANAIRGFDTGAAEVRFQADRIALGNASGRRTSAVSASPLAGSLVLDAAEIALQADSYRVERFQNVQLAASSLILSSGVGSFSVPGRLELATPLLTSAGAASTDILADGMLELISSTAPTSGATASGGLGAKLNLTGQSVSLDGNISLPSGSLSVLARTGDATLGLSKAAAINLTGRALTFLDETRYTNAGSVGITADLGSVSLGSLSTIDLSATGSGDAGSLSVRTVNGSFDLNGTILGSAAAGRNTGSFRLDAARVSGNDLTTVDALLNAGSFTQFRDYRIRTGNLAIGGTATSKTYRVAVDDGNLTISGTINASGRTGGTIDLAARGSLLLQAGAALDASAEVFDAAGKGGAVSLAAGTSRSGSISPSAQLNLAGGTIDLGVDEKSSSSAASGKFSGTLNLRAPQDEATHTTIQMGAIGTSIQNAASIMVEAYRLYNQSSGLLDNALRDQIRTDATALFGNAGSATPAYNAMRSKIDPSGTLDLILVPGAEIINPSGSLTMGSSSSATSADWNLSGFRFGPQSAPGVLTIRAAQSLVLFNALSDGFTVNTSGTAPQNTLWLAPPSAANPNLPANRQSWSYRLSAGSDLASANYRSVLPGTGTGAIGSDQGFLDLGKNAGAATATGGTNALTSSLATTYFQVIRTGSGDIDINVARSVRLLNPLASIYTAGTQVASPTSVAAANDFVTPILNSNLNQGALGRLQQAYGAYYTMAGGNLSISAGDNLERKTRNNSGLIDDSSRQLPNNWLYRRGFVGDDGNYARLTLGSLNDQAASTTWWVDFSNFFQTSGALGGGNVTLTAGGSIRNFDAVIPTNARAAQGSAAAGTLQELGGGDLVVRAGGNLDGGIYYLERGKGTLSAGSQITTNKTRSPSPGILQSLNDPDSATLDPATWLPTTLFVGKSAFDVTAAGDILMGPMANPFLLPQGQNNGFWYKNYFSTFTPESNVRITSLGGSVTLRNEVTTSDRTSPADILQTWMERQSIPASTGAAFRQPWLRLAEDNVQPFAAVAGLRPPKLEVTSLAGNVNVVGSFSLFPSATGQLEMIAGGGSVNGFQPSGRSNFIAPGQVTQTWRSATINVSDASPATFRTPQTPLAYVSIVGTSRPSDSSITRSGFLTDFDAALTDSGSITGVFGVTQTKLALHASGPLHAGDADPLRIYALKGNLTGFNLFSPKFSRLHASNDVTDISFYLQNARDNDITIVSSGRDILPYNAASPLRKASLAPGNLPALNSGPLAGDIHIGGPGTLQILAGRNLDLGTGPTNTDGTGSGIVTLGNIRNPGLSFAGADLFAGAGLGPATSLFNSSLAIQDFIDTFLSGKAPVPGIPSGAAYLKELGITNFPALDQEQQAKVALEVFYLVLRDAGRAYNDPDSPGFGNYKGGFAAIDSLFGSAGTSGSISAQTRNIRTRTGGDIALFAPNGGLTLSNTLLADAAVPPGIVTEAGGKVSIFANQSVDIGVGRIFTLRGGDLLIWSSEGDIAAGAASKTVASAPPTRVVIDPQSAAVETDLAGLSTGGGIGVLAAVANVKPGNVDLIAPSGIIDAGDAGIRVTGNINLAATAVVNASNISVGGSSTGAPTAPAVAAPNIGGMTGAAGASAANSNAASAATEAASKKSAAPTEVTEVPSLISVEVLGYGGGSAEDPEEEKRRG